MKNLAGVYKFLTSTREIHRLTDVIFQFSFCFVFSLNFSALASKTKQTKTTNEKAMMMRRNFNVQIKVALFVHTINNEKRYVLSVPSYFF